MSAGNQDTLQALPKAGLSALLLLMGTASRVQRAWSPPVHLYFEQGKDKDCLDSYMVLILAALRPRALHVIIAQLSMQNNH